MLTKKVLSKISILLCTAITLTSCHKEIDCTNNKGYNKNTVQFGIVYNNFTPGTRGLEAEQLLQADSPAPDNERTIGPALFFDGTDSVYLSTSTRDNNLGLPTPQTRGTIISTKYLFDSFGVSAYKTNGNFSSSAVPNFFYNAVANKEASSTIYTLTTNYYWPGGSDKISFFAHYPVNDNNYKLSSQSTAGDPTITVTVPDDVTQQQDLLTASAIDLNADYNNTVSLNFKHAIAAIEFVYKETMVGNTIDSIKFKNIYSVGTFNIVTQTWSNLSKLKDYSITLNKTLQDVKDKSITTANQTFFMIPILPSNAALEVTYTVPGKGSITKEISLAQSHWKQGKITTYTLGRNSWTYTLEVNDTIKFTYQGLPFVTEEQVKADGFANSLPSLNIKSFKEKDGNQVKEPWIMQFYDENSNSWSTDQPEWIETITTSGNGSVDATQYNIQLTQSQGTLTHTHRDNLRAKAEVGTSSAPYNLANTNGSSAVENTANCYMIHAPGYYRLPLVYGNAIKNSQENTLAYDTKLPQNSNYLTTFINHLGNPITSPYLLKNQNVTAKSAELVWEDCQGLIKNVQLHNHTQAEQAYISFYVDKAVIDEANAVIAVKDNNGVIAWSWQLWVCDYPLQKVEMDYGEDKKGEWTDKNIGHCSDGEIIYPKRSYKIKIKTNHEEKIVNLVQEGLEEELGTSTYYCYGNKTPFPRADVNSGYFDDNGPEEDNYLWGSFKTFYLYNISKNEIDFEPKVLDNTIIIKNPSTLYSNMPYPYIINLWNSMRAQNMVVKSVYDPCPVGYRVISNTKILSEANAELMDYFSNNTPYKLSELTAYKAKDDTFDYEENYNDRKYYGFNWLYAPTTFPPKHPNKTIKFPTIGCINSSYTENDKNTIQWFKNTGFTLSSQLLASDSPMVNWSNNIFHIIYGVYPWMISAGSIGFGYGVRAEIDN